MGRQMRIADGCGRAAGRQALSALDHLFSDALRLSTL